MSKQDKVKTRHDAIKQLIKTYAIPDQETLVEMIKEKYGIDTNQSIVSRDIRHLSITKQKVGDTHVYELKEKDASKEILRLAIVDVEHNEVMVAVKTLPGLADFVGDYLDMQENIGILGTLAGENVVFVSPRSVKEIKKVFEQVCILLYFKKEL